MAAELLCLGGEGGTAGGDPEPSTEQGLRAGSVSQCPTEELSGKNRPEDRRLSAVSEISACLVFKPLGNAL